MHTLTSRVEVFPKEMRIACFFIGICARVGSGIVYNEYVMLLWMRKAEVVSRQHNHVLYLALLLHDLVLRFGSQRLEFFLECRDMDVV